MNLGATSVVNRPFLSGRPGAPHPALRLVWRGVPVPPTRDVPTPVASMCVGDRGRGSEPRRGGTVSCATVLQGDVRGGPPTRVEEFRDPVPRVSGDPIFATVQQTIPPQDTGGGPKTTRPPPGGGRDGSRTTNQRTGGEDHGQKEEGEEGLLFMFSFTRSRVQTPRGRDPYLFTFRRG